MRIGAGFGIGVFAAVLAIAPPGGRAQMKAPAKKAGAPAAFDRGLLRPALLKERAPEVYDVRVATSRGDFVVRVTRAWAPRGADRFYNLVRRRFYDGAHFFRVLPGFVVQFGISAHPQVSRAWQTATIPDDPVKQSNTRGYVTFATSGPNTRTTQVFINLHDRNAQLDAMGFAPFGQVVEGMNVVEQLYSGYGEGSPQGNGPRQDLIQARGKAYLEAQFPKLDRIVSAKLVIPPSSQPAATKAPGATP